MWPNNLFILMKWDPIDLHFSLGFPVFRQDPKKNWISKLNMDIVMNRPVGVNITYISKVVSNIF